MMMITIRNTNEKYGDPETSTGETLAEAVATMQQTIRDCGPEFADVMVTEDDYEVVPITAADLERELARIGVLATNDSPELFDAYDDDPDLPEGWARISDSACSAYGPAAELLAALEAVPHTGGTGHEGESVDFRATWEALCGFPDTAPTSEEASEWEAIPTGAQAGAESEVA